MPPLISIIIPTYNHLTDCLVPCIESIKKFTDLSNIEVIIVANGCIDNTAEYVNSLGEPFKLVWFNDGLGYTKATNEGILASSGQYVLLLNNDIELLPQTCNNWIDLLLQPFLADPKVAISGVTELFCEYSRTYFIVFFCAMIRRAVFDELGLLDESFSPGYGEDIEFSIRCRNAGYKLSVIYPSEVWTYLTSFPIYHAGEKTVFDNPEWQHIVKRNDKYLYDRFHKDIKNSIIIFAPDDKETLQRCIISIFKYTDFTETEVIISAKENAPNWDYVRCLLNRSPYRLSVRESDNFDDAILEASKIASGQYIIVLDGKAEILETSIDWISLIKTPFLRENIKISSPMIWDNTPAHFCFATYREYLLSFNNLTEAFAGGQIEQVCKNGDFPLYIAYNSN